MGMVFKKNDKKTENGSTPHSGGSFHNKNRNHKESRKEKFNHADGDEKNKKPKNDTRDTICYGCGRPHHKSIDCILKHHPDFNREKGVKWNVSANGKSWKAKGDSFLPWSKTLSGKVWEDAPPKPTSKQGELLNHLKNNDTLLIDYTYTLPCKITELQDNPLDIQALIDTGALQSNYVNKQTADWLIQHGIHSCENKNLSVVVCLMMKNHVINVKEI